MTTLKEALQKEIALWEECLERFGKGLTLSYLDQRHSFFPGEYIWSDGEFSKVNYTESSPLCRFMKVDCENCIINNSDDCCDEHVNFCFNRDEESCKKMIAHLKWAYKYKKMVKLWRCTTLGEKNGL